MDFMHRPFCAAWVEGHPAVCHRREAITRNAQGSDQFAVAVKHGVARALVGADEPYVVGFAVSLPRFVNRLRRENQHARPARNSDVAGVLGAEFVEMQYALAQRGGKTANVQGTPAKSDVGLAVSFAVEVNIDQIVKRRRARLPALRVLVARCAVQFKQLQMVVPHAAHQFQIVTHRTDWKHLLLPRLIIFWLPRNPP
jgi:hypothetical protein